MKKFSLLMVVLFSATIFCKQNQQPKNIILLIGDGMGISAVSASVHAIDNDQFKKFKSIGLVNTCSADKLVTDSAAGATAYATGYRTNNGKLGIDPNGKKLENIVELAKKKKMSAGVVVTCSVTNATPAAFLSHVESRKSEFEIAEQIFKNNNVDLILGAGSDFFLPKNLGGKRDDNKNIVDSMKSKGYKVLVDTTYSAQSFNQKTLGLFAPNAFSYATKRNFTLGEISKEAIEYLSKNKNGFFLMIEGSQIDWAEEHNDKEYFYSEMKDFNTAIKAALDFAEKDKNTLVIVLADHDTGSFGINAKNNDTGLVDWTWASNKHTANLIGMFSFGPGADLFNGIQNNFEVGRKLINFVEKKF